MLRKAIDSTANRYSSCQLRGTHLISFQKVSLSKCLVQFNEHGKIDFMNILELDNVPIIHMIDVEI